VDRRAIVSSASAVRTRNVFLLVRVTCALLKPGLVTSGSNEAFTASSSFVEGSFNRIVAFAFIQQHLQIEEEDIFTF